jgi:hypothetical protein
MYFVGHPRQATWHNVFLLVEKLEKDRVPSVVYLAARHRVWRHGPGGSAGDWREAHGRIIAQKGDGFQRQVAAALDGPLVVLFEKDGADQTGDGVLVWERCRSLRFCA